MSDEEHVDALPVLAEVSEVRPVEPAPARSLVQRVAALPAPALAAAGGFLAGVVTFVLFRARHPRRTLRLGRRRGGRRVEVAESRSFLVDIHLLKR